MTKKHFEAIAARIRHDVAIARERFPQDYRETVRAARYAAHLFADVAGQDNARFDRQRFFDACGAQEWLEVR